jgi:hypothetical protein
MKHHFVPQFYLAGFTESGRKDDFLWVVPRDGGNLRRQRVPEVAHERDFYRVDDVESLGPQVIEKRFAEFEGRVAPVLQRVTQERALPSNTEDWSLLVSFIALMAARTPRARAVNTKAHRMLYEHILRQAVATPETYAKTIETLRRRGGEEPAVTYEDMQRFVEEKPYKVEIPVGLHMKSLFATQEAVFQGLARRHWILLTPEQGAEFVTSDDPVYLGWSDAAAASSYRSPGFALPRTEVLFPLGHGLAMMGTMERHPRKPSAIKREGVALLNTLVAMQGIRYALSATPEPLFRTPGGSVVGPKGMKQVFREDPVPREYLEEEQTMVEVHWSPENAKPANADVAQRVIDAAFGLPHAGRVELVWEGNGWHVRFATYPAVSAYRDGESFDPLQRDMRAEVEAALTNPGFLVNARCPRS